MEVPPFDQAASGPAVTKLRHAMLLHKSNPEYLLSVLNFRPERFRLCYIAALGVVCSGMQSMRVFKALH